ncbi:MAG: hypothetical protein IT184_04285 [Acidobacteria bacterium]|nr:hypothetical protein [Acidobacteriota bacterium]
MTGSRTDTPPSRALWPVLASAAGLLVLTTALVTPADADLWGHLRFGLDILASGDARQRDQYSFASDRPWVNHEWLTELAIAAVYRAGGPGALIAMKLAIVGACLWMVWHHYRRAGASVDIAVFAMALAFTGTYWRTHTIRPQLFSVLLMSVLLALMRRAERGRSTSLLLVPPLMALWANLHGGWIVGAGVFGVWASLGIVDSTLPLRSRAARAAAALLAVTATLATPEGVELWRFLATTVRLGRDDIQEWSSTLSSPIALGVPWLAAAGTAAWAAYRTRTRRLDRLVLAVLLAIASFRVSRLDAFFALAIVFLWSDEIVAAWPRRRLAWPRLAAPQIAVAMAAVGVMAMPVAGIARPFAGCLTMAGDWLPEPDAVRFAHANRLRGRMLTWFDWGEYAIWHLGPDLKVSFDGRRETVFSADTIASHRRFYAGDDKGWDLLDRLQPDYIWLPRHLPVVPQLERRGWVAIFTGSSSTMLARAGAGPFTPITTTPPARRCFPGP